MDSLIEQFENVSIDMETYYVNDFKSFYQDLGYSPKRALCLAKAAAKEQVEIDMEAAKSRKRNEMRKRLKNWMDLRVKRDTYDEIKDLFEKLSI